MILKSLLLMLIAFPVCTLGQQLSQFHVQAAKIDGLKPAQEEKMKLALLVFEKVMNDKDFQKELADLKFYSDTDDDPNKTLNASQMVEKIYAAKEFYNSQADYKADVYWLIKKKRKPLFSKYPAIGYGNETEKEIYTYSWYLEKAVLAEIVGHIAHEWTHKLGFVHQFEPHKRRDETLPYAFGYLVEKHSTKYIPSANSASAK